jgi:hypothetical protein
MWLNHAPNYDEVTNWYVCWKGMMSEQLRAQPAVEEQFCKALELMNRAVTSPGQSMAHQPGQLNQCHILPIVVSSTTSGSPIVGIELSPSLVVPTGEEITTI